MGKAFEALTGLLLLFAIMAMCMNVEYLTFFLIGMIVITSICCILVPSQEKWKILIAQTSLIMCLPVAFIMTIIINNGTFTLYSLEMFISAVAGCILPGAVAKAMIDSKSLPL